MNKLAMHYVSHKEKKERIDKYDYCTSNVLKKKKRIINISSHYAILHIFVKAHNCFPFKNT